MRRFWWVLGLSLTMHAALLAQPAQAPEVPAEVVPTDPTETPLKVLRALRTNDFAGLIEATGGEDELRQFLQDDGGETPESVAQKVASTPASEDEAEFLAMWTTLAGPDGVARTSARWYPLWQQKVPQMLAGAQMGLAGMGAAIAESTTMSELERAQMMELQWALTGWLSRTDFNDRKRFEQVLGLAREWILASGKAHPAELILTRPEQRLALAERGMKSTKRALGLYGLDADALLASVKIELLARDSTKAQVRYSLKFLDVPLALEQDLEWYQAQWMPADTARTLRSYEERAQAEKAAAAKAPAGTVALDGEPVFRHPVEQE